MNCSLQRANGSIEEYENLKDMNGLWCMVNIEKVFLLQEGGRTTSEIASESNAGPQLVIWGTDVVVDHCKTKFRKFVQQFVDPNIDTDERFEGIDPNEPLYMQRLEEV